MEDNGQQSPRVGTIAILATLGLLSAAFGFAAEATKPQLAEVKGVMEDEVCTYPSIQTPLILGGVAIVALLVSRLYCPGTRTASSMVQLSRYLSWITWVGAMSFYVMGIIMITNQGQEVRYVDYETQEEHQHYHYGGTDSYYTCNVIKPGIFGAGASFALASIMLEIIYLVVTFQHIHDKTNNGVA